ncbi:MAG TPA: DUF448 domain-containing protein [Polyangiales bacterium]|nr:DUF448 domain-containing protein [Polyangiales bacterium]
MAAQDPQAAAGTGGADARSARKARRGRTRARAGGGGSEQDVQGARLCAGCRQHDEREALLRLVLADDPPRIVPDVARGARGRGVSVHATRRCLQSAVRSGALQRGLRVTVETSADELATWAAGQYARRLEGLLAAAHRTRGAAVGSERVRDAIAQRSVELLVLAHDAGEGQQDLQQTVERLGGRCALYGDKESLGRLFGRELVAVLAITDPAIAEAARSALRCLGELGGAAGTAVGASDSNAAELSRRLGRAQHDISG